MEVDVFFTRVWEMGLKFVGVEPRVLSQTFGDSNIQDQKRPLSGKNYSFWENLNHYLAKRVYRLKTKIIRIYYNLKCYFYY